MEPLVDLSGRQAKDALSFDLSIPQQRLNTTSTSAVQTPNHTQPQPPVSQVKSTPQDQHVNHRKPQSHKQTPLKSYIIHSTNSSTPTSSSELFSKVLTDTIKQAKTISGWNVADNSVHSNENSQITGNGSQSNTISIKNIDTILQNNNLQNSICVSQYPLPWCTSCCSWAYSGQFFSQKVTDNSIYIAFPISASSDCRTKLGIPSELHEISVNFLVWTSSAWSLPLSCGLSLGSGNYSCFHTSAGIFIVLSHCLERIKQLFVQRGISVFSTIGNSLTGDEIKELVPTVPHIFRSDKDVPVVISKQISDDLGTGIVHLVPECSQADFLLFSQNRIPIIRSVGADGTFHVPVLRTKASDNTSIIEETESPVFSDSLVQTLLNDRHLFFWEDFVHKVPHCKDCGKRLSMRLESHLFLEFPKSDTKSDNEGHEINNKKQGGKPSTKKPTQPTKSSASSSSSVDIISSVIESFDKMTFLPSSSFKKIVVGTLNAGILEIFPSAICWRSGMEFPSSVTQSFGDSSVNGWVVGSFSGSEQNFTVMPIFYSLLLELKASASTTRQTTKDNHYLLLEDVCSQGSGAITWLLTKSLLFNASTTATTTAITTATTTAMTTATTTKHRTKEKSSSRSASASHPFSDNVSLMFYSSSSPSSCSMLSTTKIISDSLRLFVLDKYANKQQDNNNNKEQQEEQQESEKLALFQDVFGKIFSLRNELISYGEITATNTNTINTINCPLDLFIMSEILKEKTKIMRAMDALDFPSAMKLLRGLFLLCSEFYFPAKINILKKLHSSEFLRRYSAETKRFLDILIVSIVDMLQPVAPNLCVGIPEISEEFQSENYDTLSSDSKRLWSSLEKLKEHITKQVKLPRTLTQQSQQQQEQNNYQQQGQQQQEEDAKLLLQQELEQKSRVLVTLEADTCQDAFNVLTLMQQFSTYFDNHNSNSNGNNNSFGKLILNYFLGFPIEISFVNGKPNEDVKEHNKQQQQPKKQQQQQKKQQKQQSSEQQEEKEQAEEKQEHVKFSRNLKQACTVQFI